MQNNISRNGTAFVKNANPLGYYPLAPDQGGKPFAQATAGPQFRPNFFREGTGQMQPRDGGPSYPAYQKIMVALEARISNSVEMFAQCRCILCMMNVVCLMVVVLLCCVVLRVTDDGCEKP